MASGVGVDEVKASGPPSSDANPRLTNSIVIAKRLEREDDPRTSLEDPFIFFLNVSDLNALLDVGEDYFTVVDQIWIEGTGLPLERVLVLCNGVRYSSVDVFLQSVRASLLAGPSNPHNETDVASAERMRYTSRSRHDVVQGLEDFVLGRSVWREDPSPKEDEDRKALMAKLLSGASRHTYNARSLQTYLGSIVKEAQRALNKAIREQDLGEDAEDEEEEEEDDEDDDETEEIETRMLRGEIKKNVEQAIAELKRGEDVSSMNEEKYPMASFTFAGLLALHQRDISIEDAFRAEDEEAQGLLDMVQEGVSEYAGLTTTRSQEEEEVLMTSLNQAFQSVQSSGEYATIWNSYQAIANQVDALERKGHLNGDPGVDTLRVSEMNPGDPGKWFASLSEEERKVLVENVNTYQQATLTHTFTLFATLGTLTNTPVLRNVVVNGSTGLSSDDKDMERIIGLADIMANYVTVRIFVFKQIGSDRVVRQIFQELFTAAGFKWEWMQTNQGRQSLQAKATEKAFERNTKNREVFFVLRDTLLWEDLVKKAQRSDDDNKTQQVADDDEEELDEEEEAEEKQAEQEREALQKELQTFTKEQNANWQVQQERLVAMRNETQLILHHRMPRVVGRCPVCHDCFWRFLSPMELKSNRSDVYSCPLRFCGLDFCLQIGPLSQSGNTRLSSLGHQDFFFVAGEGSEEEEKKEDASHTGDSNSHFSLQDLMHEYTQRIAAPVPVTDIPSFGNVSAATHAGLATPRFYFAMVGSPEMRADPFTTAEVFPDPTGAYVLQSISPLSLRAWSQGDVISKAQQLQDAHLDQVLLQENRDMHHRMVQQLKDNTEKVFDRLLTIGTLAAQLQDRDAQVRADAQRKQEAVRAAMVHLRGLVALLAQHARFSVELQTPSGSRLRRSGYQGHPVPLSFSSVLFVYRQVAAWTFHLYEDFRRAVSEQDVVQPDMALASFVVKHMVPPHMQTDVDVTSTLLRANGVARDSVDTLIHAASQLPFRDPQRRSPESLHRLTHQCLQAFFNVLTAQTAAELYLRRCAGDNCLSLDPDGVAMDRGCLAGEDEEAAEETIAHLTLNQQRQVRESRAAMQAIKERMPENVQLVDIATSNIGFNVFVRDYYASTTKAEVWPRLLTESLDDAMLMQNSSWEFLGYAPKLAAQQVKESGPDPDPGGSPGLVSSPLAELYQVDAKYGPESMRRHTIADNNAAESVKERWFQQAQRFFAANTPPAVMRVVVMFGTRFLLLCSESSLQYHVASMNLLTRSSADLLRTLRTEMRRDGMRLGGVVSQDQRHIVHMLCDRWLAEDNVLLDAAQKHKETLTTKDGKEKVEDYIAMLEQRIRATKRVRLYAGQDKADLQFPKLQGRANPRRDTLFPLCADTDEKKRAIVEMGILIIPHFLEHMKRPWSAQDLDLVNEEEDGDDDGVVVEEEEEEDEDEAKDQDLVQSLAEEDEEDMVIVTRRQGASEEAQTPTALTQEEEANVARVALLMLANQRDDGRLNRAVLRRGAATLRNKVQQQSIQALQQVVADTSVDENVVRLLEDWFHADVQLSAQQYASEQVVHEYLRQDLLRREFNARTLRASHKYHRHFVQELMELDLAVYPAEDEEEQLPQDQEQKQQRSPVTRQEEAQKSQYTLKPKTSRAQRMESGKKQVQAVMEKKQKEFRASMDSASVLDALAEEEDQQHLRFVKEEKEAPLQEPTTYSANAVGLSRVGIMGPLFIAKEYTLLMSEYLMVENAIGHEDPEARPKHLLLSPLIENGLPFHAFQETQDGNRFRPVQYVAFPLPEVQYRHGVATESGALEMKLHIESSHQYDARVEDTVGVWRELCRAHPRHQAIPPFGDRFPGAAGSYEEVDEIVCEGSATCECAKNLEGYIYHGINTALTSAQKMQSSIPLAKSMRAGVYQFLHGCQEQQRQLLKNDDVRPKIQTSAFALKNTKITQRTIEKGVSDWNKTPREQQTVDTALCSFIRMHSGYLERQKTDYRSRIGRANRLLKEEEKALGALEKEWRAEDELSRKTKDKKTPAADLKTRREAQKKRHQQLVVKRQQEYESLQQEALKICLELAYAERLTQLENCRRVLGLMTRLLPTFTIIKARDPSGKRARSWFEYLLIRSANLHAQMRTSSFSSAPPAPTDPLDFSELYYAVQHSRALVRTSKTKDIVGARPASVVRLWRQEETFPGMIHVALRVLQLANSKAKEDKETLQKLDEALGFKPMPNPEQAVRNIAINDKFEESVKKTPTAVRDLLKLDNGRAHAVVTSHATKSAMRAVLNASAWDADLSTKNHWSLTYVPQITSEINQFVDTVHAALGAVQQRSLLYGTTEAGLLVGKDTYLALMQGIDRELQEVDRMASLLVKDNAVDFSALVYRMGRLLHTCALMQSKDLFRPEAYAPMPEAESMKACAAYVRKRIRVLKEGIDKAKKRSGPQLFYELSQYGRML